MAEFKNWCIRFDMTNIERAKKNIREVVALLFGREKHLQFEIGACFIQGEIYGDSECSDGSKITVPDIRQISLDRTGNVIYVTAEDREYFVRRSTAHERWYHILERWYQQNIYKIASRTGYETTEEAYASEMYALPN